MSARLTILGGLLLSILGPADLRAEDIPEIVRKAKPALFS